MYTYAFLNSIATLDLPEGIIGSLQLIVANQLAAVVELNLELEPFQSSDIRLMQAVLSHDRVIREIFEQVTVLPLRFGTCFVSRQALLEHLESYQTEYLSKLNRLQGQAEYLLKLTPVMLPEPSIAADVKGKEYFLAKKKQFQAQAEWQQQQQEELDELVQTIAQAYPNLIRTESSDGVERVYLLGDRQQAPAFQEYLNRLPPHPHWELSIGEALPPYHFV
ncbi:MAG: gas vesicle protein [Cyanobacteria bacterium CRU_2_1]|nr:gas vesicle protein [Cyanobacteria bacterium RU_5_0]NJR62472.1 gas vesicle protein [Cyanobacteria bacterium CRU_2_1]